MTRRQFKKLAHERYTNDILTPLERRRKAIEIDMKALTKEKIDEVKALIESGAKKADIIEQTGVSASTVDRVKAGQLTAEGKTEGAVNFGDMETILNCIVIETMWIYLGHGFDMLKDVIKNE